MSTDTVVSPAGQSAIVGHGGGHGCHDGDKSFHAALIADAGHQRTATQLAFDGRFDGQANLTTMMALKDSDSRNADRNTEVLTAIKEESGRTRELIQAQKMDDLRFENLRLAGLVRA